MARAMLSENLLSVKNDHEDRGGSKELVPHPRGKGPIPGQPSAACTELVPVTKTQSNRHTDPNPIR